MHPSTQVVTPWQRLKHTMHVFLFVSLLVLIVVGMDFLLLASAPFGSQRATTNGTIRIGGMAATIGTSDFPTSDAHKNLIDHQIAGVTSDETGKPG